LEHSSTSEHGAARTLAADGIAPSVATNSGGHPESSCNCRTTAAGGLAAAVFAAFPHADIYTDGTARSPGSIHIRGGGVGSGDISVRGVINMLAQDLPGKPPTHNGESSQQRHLWFQQCLHAMEAVGSELHSVAFPYGIGCGLAGGDWHISGACAVSCWWGARRGSTNCTEVSNHASTGRTTEHSESPIRHARHAPSSQNHMRDAQ
jgi:hypothetical protein